MVVIGEGILTAQQIGIKKCSHASIVVCLHVAMKVPRLRKSKITNFATVRLFATVNPLMLSES